MNTVKIQESWYPLLQHEFEKEYFLSLVLLIKTSIAQGKIIYPPGSLIFNAFNKTPMDKLKCVILGQDPYHGPGEAMGLCFSVPKSIQVPPSLKNIFKELERSFGFKPPDHGDLSSWAEQGVLLLNASLTVEHKKPNSHKAFGWHEFTDEVIRQISKNKQHIVFLLWGNFARSKKSLIDQTKHLVLESPHPSPLAGTGFYGNNHFAEANNYLMKMGIAAINWELK